MNEDFKKRSESVLHAVKVLSENEPGVIFLGGSAIQKILPKPKRLSIDLDVAYAGKQEKLVEILRKAGYSVAERKTGFPDFSYYLVSREDAKIKLDIGKFSVPDTNSLKIGGVPVRIPVCSYFLASKLSCLASGTIGRRFEEPFQTIKDIFDINCLLDLREKIDGMEPNWKQIISDQNRIRKENFQENQCLNSIQKKLFSCIPTSEPFNISKHEFGSFQDTLLEGKISRTDFSEMSARALLLSSYMGNEFYAMEKKAAGEAADRKKLADAETFLRRKIGMTGIDEAQLYSIKVNAPRSLMYLKHWAENPRRDNPATTRTPGVFSAKYS